MLSNALLVNYLSKSVKLLEVKTVLLNAPYWLLSQSFSSSSWPV